jgi:hypothetical protein
MYICMYIYMCVWGGGGVVVDDVMFVCFVCVGAGECSDIDGQGYSVAG